MAGGDEQLLVRGVVGQEKQRPRVCVAKLIALFVLGQLCKRLGHGVCDEEEDGYDGLGFAPWGCACVCVYEWRRLGLRSVVMPAAGEPPSVGFSAELCLASCPTPSEVAPVLKLATLRWGEHMWRGTGAQGRAG